LFGFTAVELPSGTLKSVPFTKTIAQQIIAAQVLVFPSPFAIVSAFKQCAEIRHASGLKLPVLAVIGKASHQVLLNEIALLGADLCEVANDVQIIANHVEPFDAEHLWPLIRQAFSAQTATASSINVVLMSGDQTNNDGNTWQGWLAESSSINFMVEQVQIYEHIPTERYADQISASQPKHWCNTESFVYFTSSSVVRQFAIALQTPEFLAKIGASNATPTALVIHPKIAQEVAKHLGWKVVEIPSGTKALLHCMSENSISL
jgi:uroporphyrinogen-III synthase